MAALSGCPPSPHPPPHFGSGGRRRPPRASAVGRNMDVAGWCVEEKRNPKGKKTCPHRHPLEVGTCGCGRPPQPSPPDLLITHSLSKVAAAVCRHISLPPPASSPTQSGQRRPTPVPKRRRLLPPHHPLNVDSGGHHPTSNAAASSPPTIRSMLKSAAAISRHTWLPPTAAFATQCLYRRPPPAAISSGPRPQHHPVTARSGGRGRPSYFPAPPPFIHHSMWTAAPAAGRDSWPTLPLIHPVQCWQRPPYPAVAPPKATHLRLAEAAAAGRQSRLSPPPRAPLKGC
ncbi:hypothetical protein I4F81_006082 [Pyropia yezoensis]|uniref:Uncharacterized protein n=1 Tax=Pyropia yezoensis TaxID=2788 RepID=A0ACC3C037_PYRYE|nr:hypothetical protein I4F81_006082 [Neopyropia yezoensis]